MDKSTRTQQFNGRVIKYEHFVRLFAPYSFIFPQNLSHGICPVRKTYNHVQMFFALEWKKQRLN